MTNTSRQRTQILRHMQNLDSIEKELRAWPQASQYLQNHSVEELVLHYFRLIYGDDVACVNVVPNQHVRWAGCIHGCSQ